MDPHWKNVKCDNFIFFMLNKDFNLPFSCQNCNIAVPIGDHSPIPNNVIYKQPLNTKIRREADDDKDIENNYERERDKFDECHKAAS